MKPERILRVKINGQHIPTRRQTHGQTGRQSGLSHTALGRNHRNHYHLTSLFKGADDGATGSSGLGGTKRLNSDLSSEPVSDGES